jgi:NADPH-dependent 2,4-dienoyl-CoA reductase/sulfur reductase-like enzyme
VAEQEAQVTERLVVIGGDAAGMAAASQARKRRPADDLQIVAFERGTVTSYAACGIPYWVGGVVEDRDDLVVRTPEKFRADQDIEVHLRHEVTAIDTDRGVVTVRDLEAGEEREVGYDQLVIATGASPFRPPVDNIDARGVHGVQTLDDGAAIRAALDGAQRVVVVGSGYIGLEMAEAMTLNGCEVTVVDLQPQPMSTLDPDMGEMIADAMRGMGMDVRVDTPIRGFDVDDGGHVTAVRTDGGELPADLVILGTGTRPNSGIAADAGIPVGETGGIVVDHRMRTRVDGVWAAGDCIEVFHRVSRCPVAIALGTHANKQGRACGINLGGGYATFDGVVGTAVTKVCGTEVARTGLNEREATAAGFDHVTAKVRTTTRAGYFPGASRLTVKVLAERRTGRLLGAQIVGEEGAAKRIDVFATALWNDMTVDQLIGVDLSYAPPFAPVWDPVLIAARKASDAVEDDLRRRW